DFIIGALMSASGNESGGAFIRYGNATYNNQSYGGLVGGVPGSHFGSSVSSAGDVNNDGYDDAIIGAPGYGSDSGRAFIFFGGVNFDIAPDLILMSDAASISF